MLRRRLTVRFAWQMAIAGLLLLILAILIFAWMFRELESIEIKRNFAPYGISRLIAESTVDEHGLLVSEKLLEQLEQDGGWLQSLDEHGNVLQSFFTPDDVPISYHPGQLIDYWYGVEPFPYTLGFWIQQKDDRFFIMLYGKSKAGSLSLQPYMAQAEIADGSITFPHEVEASLTSMQAWVQIVDQQGNEIASWHKPDHAVSSYTLRELTLRSSYPERYGTMLQSQYDEQRQLTWIVQTPMDSSKQSASMPGMPDDLRIIVISIALFLAAAFLIMVMLAFGYANLFVKPIIDIVGWIQRLGSDQEDADKLPQPAAKSIFKRRKHLFKEVQDSIHALAAELRASKAAAKQTQAYREEWIAGVTHDMRTPLSSIQGYAHMLAADKYSWTEEEVRSFAATILKKSQYMDQLLEDLALTYRLRSGKLPVSLDLHNVGALLKEAVEHAAANPLSAGRSITCHIPGQHIYGYLYPPWFERIVENLIANAVLHNPGDTKIVIELIPLAQQGWQLNVQDNGNGMDTPTIEQLFERYYRGTNTDESIEGSGLGMAITKELVQAMGGRIEVASQPDEGSTISLIWEGQRNKAAAVDG